METEASAWAFSEAAKQPPTFKAASPPLVTAAWAPSAATLTLPMTLSSLPFMPTETLSKAGRFLVRAALSFMAASASAAPSILTITCGGLHSALPLTSASQLALHSALISGGLTVPLHFGAFISTLHLPEQVPLHSPAAFISQLAEHEP